MGVQKKAEMIGSSSRIKVYVCCPYRATSVDEADRNREHEDNENRVRKACRLLTLMGYLPMAAQGYFPEFLSDDDADERKLGMELGQEWLAESDELWVFGDRISEGMKIEISFAEKYGIPVRHVPEPDELARQLYETLKREISESAGN